MNQAAIGDSDLSDADLVERAQQGEINAVGELYDRHYTRIFRYLWLRVGSRPVAEDLAGQTFLQMVKALSTYRWQNVPFQAWLYRIAHNLMVDYVRKQVPLHNVPLYEAEHLSGGEVNPAAMVEEQLTIERIQQALYALDPLQQEVVVLRFVAGLSLQEVAAAVKKSVPAIKSLQRRGLAALRRILSEA